MLSPSDEQELATCVREGAGPFEIVGGGTKGGIGAPARGEPLSTAALSGLIDYHPEELVITVRAGTLLTEVVATLAASGQRLAFEPVGLPGTEHGAQTIGGVLASNLSGSRRVTAGAARDHFLGFRAVNGLGTAFKAGGPVVKNVTGYDLPKLLAGSWGTLAVLTQVTLRAVPAAEVERTLVFEAASAARAVEHMSAVLGSSHEVSCAAWEPDSRRGWLRMEGFAESVEARFAALTTALGDAAVGAIDGAASRELWQGIGGAAAFADEPVVWRVSVPPGDASRVLDAISPRRALLDWGGGLLWLACDEVDAARVRGALRSGHATLIRAPAAAREAVATFQPPAGALTRIAERVKAAFDPDGKLNPGRMG